MRRGRLLIILCAFLITLFSLLCFKSIFSISDVNAVYSVYNSQNISTCDNLLKKYNGKNLLFVKTSEIENLINDNTNLKIESVVKDYPNKLVVNLKERMEIFAVKTSEGYAILDEEYTVLDVREDYINKFDNLDNVVVKFENSEFDPSKLTLRSSLDIGNLSLQNSVLKILSSIEMPRDYVKEITVVEKEKGVNYYVYLKTIEGVVIEVRKALDKPDEKISVAMQKYFSLSDNDRLSGSIAVYTLDNGNVLASYVR